MTPKPREFRFFRRHAYPIGIPVVPPHTERAIIWPTDETKLQKCDSHLTPLTNTRKCWSLRNQSNHVISSDGTTISDGDYLPFQCPNTIYVLVPPYLPITQGKNIKNRFITNHIIQSPAPSRVRTFLSSPSFTVSTFALFDSFLSWKVTLKGLAEMYIIYIMCGSGEQIVRHQKKPVAQRLFIHDMWANS